MIKKTLLVIVLSLLIVLSACSSAPEEVPDEPVVDDVPEEVPEEPPVPTELNAVDTPTTGRVGEKLTFMWEISGEEGKAATHTAVHYGSSSEDTEPSSTMTPSDTAYTGVAGEFVTGHYALPRTFAASLIPVDMGTLYFRFHGVVEGDNYWSEEFSVNIDPLQEVEEDTSEEVIDEDAPAVVITVTESGFTPTSTTVKVGDTVQWTNERSKVSNGLTQLLRAPRSSGIQGFKSDKFYSGETWEYTFEEAGHLHYVDAIYTTQAGQIIIEP